MKMNKYQYLCSNEILKLISSLAKEDQNLSFLSNNYNSLFLESSTVNYVWPLVSTSLLMSENLYKYDKSYNMISDSTVKLIEDKLYLYPIVYPDDHASSPCLLDSKNNIADSFLHYIKCEDDPEEYYDYEKLDYIYDQLDYIDDKEYLKGEIKLAQMRSDLEKKFEDLRIDGSYGCNGSIIKDGYINTRKFIERTRNALAHSNYEVINENNIRLYHYNTNTKKLDFNVILDSSIIVLIVDELNEIASDKYSNFMNYYFDDPSEKLLKDTLSDDRIIEYMLSFDMFDEEIAKSILDEVKHQKEFIAATTDENKLIIINKMIYERIKPSYDVGIIINDYLYCNEDGRILSDELYEKYDIFNYLNSDYYNTVEGEINDDVYAQNKFKFLLLSLLNCSILNGYNLNEGKDIGIIDFSKMNISEDVLRQFLLKNSLKTFYIIDILEKEIEKNKKEIDIKTEKIEKKREILMKHNIDNDYFNVVLPSQIEQLQMEKMQIDASTISNSLVIEEAKKQGCMYNFDKNISQFVFNHLRNSLAHGYVKFPNNIDLRNASDTIITFEDYNPDNKKELTFKGTMRLGDLFETITNVNFIKNVFGLSNLKIENGEAKVKK